MLTGFLACLIVWALCLKITTKRLVQIGKDHFPLRTIALNRGSRDHPIFCHSFDVRHFYQPFPQLPFLASGLQHRGLLGSFLWYQKLQLQTNVATASCGTSYSGWDQIYLSGTRWTQKVIGAVLCELHASTHTPQFVPSYRLTSYVLPEVGPIIVILRAAVIYCRHFAMQQTIQLPTQKNLCFAVWLHILLARQA